MYFLQYFNFQGIVCRDRFELRTNHGIGSIGTLRRTKITSWSITDTIIGNPVKFVYLMIANMYTINKLHRYSSVTKSWCTMEPNYKTYWKQVNDLARHHSTQFGSRRQIIWSNRFSMCEKHKAEVIYWTHPRLSVPSLIQLVAREWVYVCVGLNKSHHYLPENRSPNFAEQLSQNQEKIIISDQQSFQVTACPPRTDEAVFCDLWHTGKRHDSSKNAMYAAVRCHSCMVSVRRRQAVNKDLACLALEPKITIFSPTLRTLNLALFNQSQLTRSLLYRWSAMIFVGRSAVHLSGPAGRINRQRKEYLSAQRILQWYRWLTDWAERNVSRLM
jgi:hypothetical protein